MTSWKRNLYAIWVAEMLAIAGFNICVPIIPFYLGDLGVSDPASLKLWVGVAQSVGAVTLAIMSPIWGSLADSYGRRLMLLRSMFGGFVVMGLMGFVTQPWQLVALRALQGVFTGTIAAATVLVATVTPEEEAGYALGLLQTAVFVGASLGPMIGGTLSDALGNRVPFWVTSVLLLAAGAIVTVFVKEEFRPHRTPGPLAKRIIPDLGILTRTKGLLSLLLAVATVQIANSVVSPILPMFVQELAPRSTLVGSTTGLILGVSALASAIASAAVGKVSGRVGYKRALLMCVVGACLLTIPQAFVRTTGQLLTLRVIGALFLGGTAPTVNAAIAGLADRAHHGTVYGLSSSISSIGSSAGPIIGAGVGMAFGFPAVFLTTAGILALTALALASRHRAPGSPARRSRE